MPPPRSEIVSPPKVESAAVGVVIVNWNTKDHLLTGLTTLLGSTADKVSWPVVVVDNASVDSSAEAIAAAFPTVRLMVNTINIGYGAAVNQGVAAIKTPYLLVANADLECPPSTVARLAEFLERHPQAAVVGPRLLNPDGTLQLSWGREPHLLSELVQRWWWRRLEVQPGQMRLRRQTAEARRVDWVLGACLMIRRQAWESVGPFAEQYFMYFEETDWCARARRAGWEIWYLPSAQAVHHGRASVSQIPDAMALRYRRSQIAYYRRFHGQMAVALLRGYLWMKLIWTPHGRQLLRQLSTAHVS